MIYFSRDEVERIGKAGGFVLHDDFGSKYRFLSSFWLYCEENDQAFTPHAMSGFWESWITRWMSQQFDEHDTFVDCGANVGYYSMMAATHGVWHTIAIEPIPELCDMIAKSASANHVSSKVEICQQVLSDVNGQVFIQIPEGHSGGTAISESGIGVESYTFDDGFGFWTERSILMKIDAEGAEPRIIAGMEKALRRHDFTICLEWDARRWDDPRQFAESLLEFSSSLAIVNHDGKEEPVTVEQLIESKDLLMVVVRNDKYMEGK